MDDAWFQLGITAYEVRQSFLTATKLHILNTG